MLTADQIQVLGDKAEGLLSPVVEFLMGDIARRVSEAGQLTATAAYMTWVAQTLGKSQKEVKKEVAKLLKKAQEEVEKLTAVLDDSLDKWNALMETDELLKEQGAAHAQALQDKENP